MQTPLWVSLSALSVIGGLGVWLLARLIHHELRERRRARHLARLAKQYRRERPVVPAAEYPPPGTSEQRITVAQLVARTEAEGLPTRLH